MPRAHLEVQGGRQLRSALRKAGNDLTDLKAVHAEVAAIVSNAARATAPRKTGRLADSVRPNASKTRARVAVGNNRSTKSGVPYAGPIHWGWPRDSRTLPRHIHRAPGWFIEPNPWITEAAQATEGRWVRVYSEEVSRIVRVVEKESTGTTNG